jgi:hypothetical protein
MFLNVAYVGIISRQPEYALIAAFFSAESLSIFYDQGMEFLIQGNIKRQRILKDGLQFPVIAFYSQAFAHSFCIGIYYELWLICRI